MKELSTFLKWGKEGIIGHKIETFESKQYVTKIWCKLCAKYREQIVNHPTCRGAPVIAIKAFADGIEEFRKGAKRPQWNSDFMNKIEARSNTGFKPILLAYWSPDGNPKKQTTGSKNKTLNQNDNE